MPIAVPDADRTRTGDATSPKDSGAALLGLQLLGSRGRVRWARGTEYDPRDRGGAKKERYGAEHAEGGEASPAVVHNASRGPSSNSKDIRAGAQAAFSRMAAAPTKPSEASHRGHSG